MGQQRDSTDSRRFDLTNYHRYRALDHLRRQRPDDWRLTSHHEFLQEWDHFRHQHADAYEQLRRQHNMHWLGTLMKRLKSAAVRLITNVLVVVTFLALLAGLIHAITTIVGG